jgi:Tfp pilus assembly protein FimT
MGARFRKEDGFTFNELLAAMGIVVFAVMAYSLSTITLNRRQLVSDNSTIAIHLAQDKIEELQARRPLADTDLCPDGGDQSLSAKSGVSGVFNRCWRIATSALAADLKQIDVVVSWRDHETHETKLTTLVFTGE